MIQIDRSSTGKIRVVGEKQVPLTNEEVLESLILRIDRLVELIRQVQIKEELRYHQPCVPFSARHFLLQVDLAKLAKKFPARR